MNEPTLCIYHANCVDGFAAAWAVWKKFPDCRFVPGRYDDVLVPEILRDESIVFVDFSLKRKDMEVVAAIAKSVTVIDHHKTAEAELQPLFDNDTINGVFDMDKSGAVLAWEWFHPEVSIPKLLLHIQDRDLWKFKRPGTREIHSSLTSYSFDFDFELFDEIATNERFLSTMIAEGTAIDRKHRLDVERMVDATKRLVVIGGHWIWCANLPPTMASDAGHAMCEIPLPAPDYAQELPAFAATYFDNADGRRVYSLRSIGDFDVSEIAKKFGGGGHKNAAGFTVERNFDGEEPT